MESITDKENISKEENEQVNEIAKEEPYPSACFLLESCFQDYQRLQDRYDKIYEKINIALAFVGVVLTIMLSSIDFSFMYLNVKDLSFSQFLMVFIKTICLFGSLILIVVSVIYLLVMLRSRRVSVFKSEDIRNSEIYKGKEAEAALWMIDKYTILSSEIRPIIQKKQETFDKTITAVIMGIVMYTLFVLLSKGGF